MAKKPSNKENAVGMVIGGGALVGTGVGFLTGQLVAGAVLGTGAGLIIAAFLMYRIK
jgi:hypothetical protein